MCNQLPMIRTISRLLVLMALASGTLVQAGQESKLLPLAAGDISAGTLHQLDAMSLVNASRDDVSVSWPVAADRAITSPQPHQAKSRAYWKRVSSAELQQGIQLTTTAPGAMVRLSPIGETQLQQERTPLTLAQFDLVDSQGVRHPLSSRIDKSASFDQLAELDAGFSPSTLLFKLDSALGSGAFELIAAPGSTAPDLVLYVFDKNSDYELNLQLQESTAFAGEDVVARVSMQGLTSSQLTLNHAFIEGPAGERVSLSDASVTPDSIELRFDTAHIQSRVPGLWALHASAGFSLDGHRYQRNIKNTLSINRAAASLSGKVSIEKQADFINLDFGLASRTAGRYEVRGVLYGTDSSGSLSPLMFASSAGWRDAGKSEIGLQLQLSKLENTHNAPYELRHLRLYDQSRMMLLHQQSRALRFE